jgi:hypothetical protein
MAIKKNLIVSIDEAAVAGELDIVSLKTTSTGEINITVNGLSPKFNVAMKDMEDALREIYGFYMENPPVSKKEESSVAPATLVADSSYMEVQHEDVPF